MFVLGDKVYVKRFPELKGKVVGYAEGQTKIIIEYEPSKTVMWRITELKRERNNETKGTKGQNTRNY